MSPSGYGHNINVAADTNKHKHSKPYASWWYRYTVYTIAVLIVITIVIIVAIVIIIIIIIITFIFSIIDNMNDLFPYT